MTKLKFCTGAAIAALLMAPLVAKAADLPPQPYKAAPGYVAPLYANWSGMYVGLNAGYAFGKSHWDSPVADPTPKGFVAGGTLGYNYQTGTWVWGLEGDFDYAAVKGSTDCGAGASCETKNDWLATARARIGYAGWTNLLPYITGGAAMGDIKANNSAASSASKTKLGWTVGAGLEYAMWSNWSVKAEYLYVDLGAMDCGTACGGTPSTSVSLKEQIVRAGLNYRF